MNDADMWRALAVLERYFDDIEVEVGQQAWRWRAVPFGPCARCYWPSHTLGPDGWAVHPFCWDNLTPPSGFDQWVLRKDGAGEWGNHAAAPPQPPGDRQWCATQGAWFQPTPERLAACAAHAKEMTARWSR